MWDHTKSMSGLELSEYATVVKQTTSTIGSVIGLPPAKSCKRSFEVTIELNRGSIHVGWVTEQVYKGFPSSIKKGVGCCPGTYAMDTLEGAVGENNKWRDFYRKKLKQGDVVLTTIDPVAGTIEYTLNGKDLGIAFKGLDTSTQYFPALSLRYNKTRVRCNFAGPFKFAAPISSLGLSAFSVKELFQFEEQSKINFRYNETDCPLFVAMRVELSCLVRILSFLRVRELSRCMRACRLLHCAGNDDLIWRSNFARSFHLPPPLDAGSGAEGAESLIQAKAAEVPSLALAPSRMMLEYKKKNDWNNASRAPKIKNFYFDNIPGSVSFDADLCVITADNVVNFIDKRTLQPFEENAKFVNNCCVNCQQFDENKLVLGDALGFITVYNLNTARPTFRVLSDDQGVESVHFNSENILLSTGWSTNIVTWDLEMEEKELVIPDAHKQAICFSNYVRNREDMIVTTSYDHTIKFFDLRSSKCTATIDFGEIPACLDFSYDGNTFAVGGSTGKISIYDMREIGTFCDVVLSEQSHKSTVTCINYDGYRLLSGSYDQRVIGWDTEQNVRDFTIKPGNKVICMHFDGTSLAVGLDGKKMSWYDFSKYSADNFAELRQVYTKRI